MTKSQFKNLIKECISEILKEGMEIPYAFLTVLNGLLKNNNLNLDFLKEISSYKNLPKIIKITDMNEDIQKINDFEELKQKLESLYFYKKNKQYVDWFLKLIKNEHEIKSVKYKLD